jgi:hypothetical protein
MLLPLYIASCSSVASIQDAADATVLDLPNLLEPLGGLLAVLQYPCSTPAVPLQYPYSTPAVPLQYPTVPLQYLLEPRGELLAVRPLAEAARRRPCAQCGVEGKPIERTSVHGPPVDI